MNGDYFFNCGPRAMVDAVLPLELQVSSADRIYSSLDYLTKCGVGLCGSCVDNKGKRTCVEGPFMKL
jgi:dihydroorotate dehydrogenase (NAD+) catalytic subunit